MTYEKGGLAQLSTVFTNIAGALTDPSALTLRVKSPGTDAVTYTYGVGTVIVRDSVGAYHADISIAASRKWRYKWASTGTLVAVKQGTFFVRPASV